MKGLRAQGPWILGGGGGGVAFGPLGLGNGKVGQVGLVGSLESCVFAGFMIGQ